MNDDTLIVTETEGDTFDLQLSESSTPETFRRRGPPLPAGGPSGAPPPGGAPFPNPKRGM